MWKEVRNTEKQVKIEDLKQKNTGRKINYMESNGQILWVNL